MTTLDDEAADTEETALTASSIPMRCQGKCFFIKMSSPIRLWGSDTYSTLLGNVPPVGSSRFTQATPIQRAPSERCPRTSENLPQLATRLKRLTSDFPLSPITNHLSPSPLPYASRAPLFDGFGRFLSLKVIDDAIDHLQVDFLEGA